MSASLNIPASMTVAEFLEWCPEDGQRWELIDGIPRAMAPPKVLHGRLLGEVIGQLRNHLLELGGPCAVLPETGVIPRGRSAHNLRVPDLLVDRGKPAANDGYVREPTLIVELLSPSNQTDTWANVWSYTTIPSLHEILVLHTLKARADILRRGEDGHWPESPITVTEGDLTLDSIGFRAPLIGLYRTTGLAASAE